MSPHLEELKKCFTMEGKNRKRYKQTFAKIKIEAPEL
jgi:hypothetical protein